MVTEDVGGTKIDRGQLQRPLVTLFHMQLK